jgi:hypothetical protein
MDLKLNLVLEFTHIDRPWKSKATEQAASLSIKSFDGRVIVGSRHSSSATNFENRKSDS